MERSCSWTTTTRKNSRWKNMFWYHGVCVCVSHAKIWTFGFTTRCRQAHADGRGVEEHSDSRGSTKTLEGVSGQGNREMNETNEVEH